LLPSIGGQPEGKATPGKRHISERLPRKKDGHLEHSLRLLDCIFLVEVAEKCVFFGWKWLKNVCFLGRSG
jgi:hypothetical protein